MGGGKREREREGEGVETDPPTGECLCTDHVSLLGGVNCSTVYSST